MKVKVENKDQGYSLTMYHFAWTDQRENRDTTEVYPGKAMHIIGG